MNFGSQTFSASCLDVTGAVAPRVSAKSSTGIRYRSRLCMTSNHHGCSQRGHVLQPLLRQGFRTAIRVLLSVTRLSLGLLDGSSRGRLVGQTSFLGHRSVALGAVRASMRDEPFLRGNRRTWPPRERSAAGSAGPPTCTSPPPRRLDSRLHQVPDTSTRSS